MGDVPATWKGIGTLATDLAVTFTPVGLFVSDERRGESGDRLIATAKAVANVEMWKENPAKAAGMLTGDLATVFLPGGAVAKGVTTAAKSGKAVSLAGKASSFVTKFGVPAAKADKFALSAVKGLNATAMRIDDVSQSVSRLKYDAKSKDREFAGVHEVIRDARELLEYADEALEGAADPEAERARFTNDDDSGRVAPGGFVRGWLPIYDHGTGAFVILDCAPGPRGRVGQILDYGEGETRVTHPDFRSWLQEHVDDLEA